MKALERLYISLNEDFVDDNIFETEEVQQAFNEFNKKYIEPAYEPNWDYGADMSNSFDNVISTERRSAFMIGFKIALGLMHESLE